MATHFYSLVDCCLVGLKLPILLEMAPWRSVKTIFESFIVEEASRFSQIVAECGTGRNRRFRHELLQEYASVQIWISQTTE
jgi:hypothetical protein